MTNDERITERISAQLNVRPSQVAAVIALLDGGATLPFIARYRKEATGSLDEEQIRHIEAESGRLRALDERRAAVIASVTEQGAMTPELAAQLGAAETLHALEDLYAPYKPKRRTRATIARERGLGLSLIHISVVALLALRVAPSSVSTRVEA